MILRTKVALGGNFGSKKLNYFSSVKNLKLNRNDKERFKQMDHVS